MQHLQLPVGWSSRWTSRRRAEQTGAEAGQQALDRTHLRHFISDGHRRPQSRRDNQTQRRSGCMWVTLLSLGLPPPHLLLISLVSPASPALSLSHCGCLLHTQSSPEAAATKFNVYTPTNCRGNSWKANNLINLKEFCHCKSRCGLSVGTANVLLRVQLQSDQRYLHLPVSSFLSQRTCNFFIFSPFMGVMFGDLPDSEVIAHSLQNCLHRSEVSHLRTPLKRNTPLTAVSRE